MPLELTTEEQAVKLIFAYKMGWKNVPLTSGKRTFSMMEKDYGRAFAQLWMAAYAEGLRDYRDTARWENV